MTHKELFGDAQWLTPDEECDGALFRSVFNAKKDSRAVITICGLGYFKLYINGIRVSDDEFVPAYTDYHDRPDMVLSYPLNDEWTYRIYCLKYDITKYIRDGGNIIGIKVGSGMYHQTMRLAEGNMSYGNIKTCYVIDIDGEKIESDCKKTLYSKAYFVQSNLYYGEFLDYTNFDRKWNTDEAKLDGWKAPKPCAAPKSNYLIQECPADRVCEILKPELVKNFGDYSVYKIPKNITGYPVIRCTKQGEKVILECAEELSDDNNIDNISVGYNIQREIEIFITDEEEVYEPEFCWFGFQYFTLSNNAEPVEVKVIHSDCKVTSDFECSDETLNWYYKAFINTQLSNMHGSVPSDCPHRERLGYTGDGQLTCDAVMTEIDSKTFYKKWIMDIRDCQDKNTGHVQHTAPFCGGGGGPSGWGGAIIKVPYIYYRHYGDIDLLKTMYPCMLKYIEYMENHFENGIVVREEKQGWCLGDWCTPTQIKLPEAYVNTTYFIYLLKIAKKCAIALDEDYSRIDTLILSHMKAVILNYYDEETNSFLGDLQGANEFAYSSGLGNDEMRENTVKKYTYNTQFDTGIMGTDLLIGNLFERDCGDLAAELLANKNEFSFETMRKWGATTLWENWNGESSHSHPMFGSCTAYLFSYILGIRQKEFSVCYNKIVIAPVFAKCLDYAKGYITTEHGKISVSWKRDGSKIFVDIDLCEGVKAEFVYKEKTIPLKAGLNNIEL